MTNSPARTAFVSVCLAALLVPSLLRAQGAEVLTNESVVQMVNGKVAKNLILAKIRSTSTAFDVTANGLVGLVRSKVDKEIIKAMMQAPAKTESKEVLTNEAVVAMVTGNLSKDLILLKIQSTKSKFDLTTTGLVSLSQNKVSPDIVKAMMAAGASESASEAANASAAPEPAAPAAKPPADRQGIETNQAAVFTASGSSKTVYENIKSRLQKQSGMTIQADSTPGQIAGVRVHKDGTTQHETRTVVKVTSAAARTTVKVSVFDKNRRSATPPARWSVEKFDYDMTMAAVADLKGSLQIK